MYPNGDPDVAQAKGFISVYLFLDNITAGPDLAANKSVFLSFSIKLVNFKTHSESVARVLETRFPIPTGEGWGDSQMAPTTLINEKNGFVRNNAIHLEVSIFVKRTALHV